jgi:hypothetical protein
MWQKDEEKKKTLHEHGPNGNHGQKSVGTEIWVSITCHLLYLATVNVVDILTIAERGVGYGGHGGVSMFAQLYN